MRRRFESGTTTSVSAAGITPGTTSTTPCRWRSTTSFRGKYLPKTDARLDLNLITGCGTCHTRLEGAHVERQFAETDRHEALRVLRVLKEGGQTVYALERELDLPEERLRSLVSQLERMNCLWTRGNVQY